MSRTNNVPNLGHIYEPMVADYLREKGYIIVQQNYKIGNYEVDLIARDGGDLVFIEIKSRQFSVSMEDVEEVIPLKKQRKLVQVADSFSRYYKYPYHSLRFDYIFVKHTSGSTPEITHIVNAFYPEL